VPVECRYCGQWRLETPGSSYHAAAAADGTLTTNDQPGG
jgi:hypothetical protein